MVAAARREVSRLLTEAKGAGRVGLSSAAGALRRGRRAMDVRAGLADLGIEAAGVGPIVPWIVGDPAVAIRIAATLRSRGVDVSAIRPPSVPPGTARLRFTVTSAHRPADIERALEVLKDVLRDERR